MIPRWLKTQFYANELKNSIVDFVFAILKSHGFIGGRLASIDIRLSLIVLGILACSTGALIFFKRRTIPDHK